MTQNPERRYLSLDGFRDLVRTVRSPDQVQTDSVAILTALPAEVRAIGEKGSRLIEFVITSDSVDREQDILSADGWSFDNYLKNPVVLWAHDHYALPVARAISLQKEGNKWRSVTEFTPKELGGGFGYMVYQMYAERYMHAVSVGFAPQEYTYAADRKYGINYIKQELLEYSCVPVPANPDALAVARSKGIDTSPLREWAEKVLDESRKGDSRLGDEARHRLEALRAASTSEGRALILELGDMRMAGTKENKNEDPAPSPGIKRVDRWECGIDGHAHASESEAKSCAEFETQVTEATQTLQRAVAAVKSGKTLRPEAGALLRAVVDELVPKADEEEESEEESDSEEAADDEGDEGGEGGDEGDGDESVELGISEEELTRAVKDAVSDSFDRLTGRVQ